MLRVMLRCSFRLASALSLLVFCRAPLAAQNVRIEIESSWEGLGTPSHSKLVVVGKDGKYKADGKAVESRILDTLLAAIDDAPIEEPSITNCGIDQKWLDANYKAALEEHTHRKLGEFSAQQVELFKSRFANPVYSQEAFAELFKYLHLDDEPRMSVTASVNGRTLGVESNSPHPFMLPWIGVDKTRGLYDCRISRAIAALVPNKFSNRDRLTLNLSFRFDLTSQVMRAIEERWGMLDTQHLVGEQIAPIVALYSPIKSAVTCIGSIDVEGCGWNATLSNSALPSNMTIGISLPYVNKRELSGVETFLKQIPDYVDLVQSVPWLSAYMKTHAWMTFELRYVADRSLSRKALTDLQKDLRKHGKSEVADMVLEQARQSAFVEVACGERCWARILVLSNRDVLLWHFQGDTVLGFPERDLNAWDFYGWHSVGVLVKPDGTLVN